tara:strand:- start:651 stop:935 length:285 start_codon:yes stop_codon:yes gene_type:complete
MSILKLKDWNKEGSELKIKYFSLTKKWLDEKTTKLHNEVESINNTIIEGKYVIHTVMSRTKDKENYQLKVRIKFYADNSKHEHKKNTHRQKINI